MFPINEWSVSPSEQADGMPDVIEDLNLENVWESNLEEEMNKLMEAVNKYPFIAMDTEFPGVCIHEDVNQNIFEYDILRKNVDELKIIQLGITLCNENGEIVESIPTWQFNFQFDPTSDRNNSISMDLLIKSGFNFDSHTRSGIDGLAFGELLTMSGLVLNDRVKWIAFHGDYDFAYLIKILTGKKLPETKEEYDKLLKVFFPHVFDVKYMLHDSHYMNCGLNRLAQQLQVYRRGQMHQSGSDSRLTAETYFKIHELFYKERGSSSYDGILYGTLDTH